MQHVNFIFKKTFLTIFEWAIKWAHTQVVSVNPEIWKPSRVIVPDQFLPLWKPNKTPYSICPMVFGEAFSRNRKK